MLHVAVCVYRYLDHLYQDAKARQTSKGKTGSSKSGMGGGYGGRKDDRWVVRLLPCGHTDTHASKHTQFLTDRQFIGHPGQGWLCACMCVCVCVCVCACHTGWVAVLGSRWVTKGPTMTTYLTS